MLTESSGPNVQGFTQAARGQGLGHAVRLGVLGGTFDPPHAGHLALARAARSALDLERVLWVVAGDPWQKRGDVWAEAADRVAMVEALIADEPAFTVSTIEVEREGPSFTADTLEHLIRGRPKGERADELVLVLGADAAAGLDTWERPDRIRELARVAIAPRPDDSTGAAALIEQLRSEGWTCDAVPMDEHPVSSTDVRERLRRGASVDGLVPAEVVRVIEERGLYTRPR